MEAVEDKERSVSCEVLAPRDGLRSVHERRGQRQCDEEQRFDPEQAQERQPPPGEFGDKEEAGGRHQCGRGEVSPSDREEQGSFGQAAEEEQGTDPAEQCQGEESIVGMEAGVGITGVDEDGRAEEKGEAEQVK